MGGGEHYHRRDHCSRHHSPPEGSQGAGNCGISVEQDCGVTMKIVSGKQVPRELAKQANRRILFTAATEKTVARIVSDVRKNGDTALRKYAQKFDGLDGQSLTVSETELSSAFESVSNDVRRALEAAAKNIRRFAQWQK